MGWHLSKSRFVGPWRDTADKFDDEVGGMPMKFFIVLVIWQPEVVQGTYRDRVSENGSGKE